MSLLLCDDPASFSVLCLKKHGKWRWSGLIICTWIFSIYRIMSIVPLSIEKVTSGLCWSFEWLLFVDNESHRWLHHGVVGTDKELDLIEMAVYGNVIRPGLQCKCKSVAETLGTALYKSKGPEVSACELPYKATSFWQLQYLNTFILHSLLQNRDLIWIQWFNWAGVGCSVFVESLNNRTAM